MLERAYDLPPVVLLGGAASLSVARSLGRAGVRVHALGHLEDPVRHSRYCTEFTNMGSPVGLVPRYRDWLTQRRIPGAVIFPCDDDGVELLATHSAELSALGYQLLESDPALADAMLDKVRTYELAREVGTAVPRTMLVRTDDELAAALVHCGMPCALKPQVSHRYSAQFGSSNKVILVDDLEQGQQALREVRDRGIDMMATEIVPGDDGAFRSFFGYLDEHGRPLVQFTKRKIRQYPVGFGLTTYQVAEWQPDVAAAALQFAQGIGLQGIVNFEFKRDPRDGVLKLIECNYRLTASNHLLTAAGIDLAMVAYRRATGMPVPPVAPPREGVHAWNVVEDVHALAEYRRRGDWTLGSWVRSVLRPQHFPFWASDDPRPSAVAAAVHARNSLLRASPRRRQAPRPATAGVAVQESRP